MTTYTIRSMTTTDANQRQPITPYHIYLRHSHLRGRAYWTTDRREVMTFASPQEAAQELARALPNNDRAQIAPLDDASWPTYWDIASRNADHYERIEERTIVHELVQLILQKGCSISVHDGEAFALVRSTNFMAIVRALFSTDGDTLFVRDAADKQLGCIALVYGNGRDVISDHTDNDDMNSLMARMSEFVQELAA